MEEKKNSKSLEEMTNDEVSLKDLISKLNDYWAEIKGKWLTMLVIMMPFVTWFGYKALITPVTYTAKITFMLNDDKGSGGIASILGRFGGLLGTSSNDYQLEKILEIARSRRVISDALFEVYDIDGTKDFFANHIIRTQQLHTRWAEDSLLKDFLFAHGEQFKFNRRENKALLALYGEMIGGDGVEYPMFFANLNDDTGIMTLSIRSQSEMLSIDYLNVLYSNLEKFYIEKSLESGRYTLALLEQKRDSIARVLNRNDIVSANFDDQNNAVLLQSDKVPAKRYQRNTQLLSVMYAEAIKNVELAEFALKSNTPFLSVIDVPIPPIKMDARGRVKGILLGWVLGFLLGITYVISIKIIKETY